MRGVLKFLSSEDKIAAELRRTFVIKIIPMLNPDGVVLGNYRCSMAGLDLNRQYRKPSKQITPSVYHIKQLLLSFPRHRVVFLCDLHGHSRKFDSFMYGCKNQGHQRERMLPLLFSKQLEDFDFNKSAFSVSRSKRGTGRVVGWSEAGITNSFTLEATFAGASIGSKAGYHYHTGDFEGIGRGLCIALHQWRQVTGDQQLAAALSMEVAMAMKMKTTNKQAPQECGSEDEESDGSDNEPCEANLDAAELKTRWATLLKKRRPSDRSRKAKSHAKRVEGSEREESTRNPKPRGWDGGRKSNDIGGDPEEAEGLSLRKADAMTVPKLLNHRKWSPPKIQPLRSGVISSAPSGPEISSAKFHEPKCSSPSLLTDERAEDFSCLLRGFNAGEHYKQMLSTSYQMAVAKGVIAPSNLTVTAEAAAAYHQQVEFAANKGSMEHKAGSQASPPSRSISVHPSVVNRRLPSTLPAGRASDEANNASRSVRSWEFGSCTTTTVLPAGTPPVASPEFELFLSMHKGIQSQPHMPKRSNSRAMPSRSPLSDDGRVQRQRAPTVLDRLPREGTPQAGGRVLSTSQAQLAFGRERPRALTPDILEQSANLRGVKFDLQSPLSNPSVLRSSNFSTRAAMKERERNNRLQHTRPLTGGREMLAVSPGGIDGGGIGAAAVSEVGGWARRYPAERGDNSPMPNMSPLSGLRLRTTQPMHRQTAARRSSSVASSSSVLH